MKTWLITGCSSGLGQGIANAVLRRGDWAAVTARDPASLGTLAQAYPERILPLRLRNILQKLLKPFHKFRSVHSLLPPVRPSSRSVILPEYFFHSSIYSPSCARPRSVT